MRDHRVKYSETQVNPSHKFPHFTLSSEFNDEEVQKAMKAVFAKKYGQDGKISRKEVPELISDFSLILATDCEEAKAYFSPSNRTVGRDVDWKY